MTPKKAADYFRAILERSGKKPTDCGWGMLDDIQVICERQIEKESESRLEWSDIRFYQIEGENDTLLLGETEADGDCFTAIVRCPERRVIGEGFPTRREAAYAVERYWHRLRA